MNLYEPILCYERMDLVCLFSRPFRGPVGPARHFIVPAERLRHRWRRSPTVWFVQKKVSKHVGIESPELRLACDLQAQIVQSHQQGADNPGRWSNRLPQVGRAWILVPSNGSHCTGGGP